MCCGVVCINPGIMACVLKYIVPITGGADVGYLNFIPQIRNRYLISNSFFGFDPPLHKPPNWDFYGPAMTPDLSNIHGRLAASSPEIAEWMTAAEEAGQVVIFISLGSEIIWQQWYVDAFYNGCIELSKRIPLRVVWGMKEYDHISLPQDYDREMFWLDKWVPQIEVLANPITKVGITHCGLGGTFEFIHTGTKALCFPHFGDQGVNARNLVERGAALSLVPTHEGERLPWDESARKFVKERFTPTDIANKLE